MGNSLMEMDRFRCDYALDRHRVRVLRPPAIDHLRASRDAMVSLRGVTFRMPEFIRHENALRPCVLLQSSCFGSSSFSPKLLTKPAGPF
jgi:hypothetical protein